jgi:hypothetical protein
MRLTAHARLPRHLHHGVEVRGVAAVSARTGRIGSEMEDEGVTVAVVTMVGHVIAGSCE